jgi:hypothetical protein
MKYIIFILSLFTLLFVPQTILRSQSLDKLEKRYIDLQDSYTTEKLLLDSLQSIFSTRLKEINLEKNKVNPDKDKIASLMGNSVNLSNRVEEQQKKVDKIEKSILSVKTGLNEKYSDIIDSLKNVQIKNKKDKEEVENLILFYSTKRLEVIPGTNLLSFNPDKILELDLNRSNNSIDKKIYSEYLNNALNEVNIVLANVSKESKEINQIIELERKANKFIEETELESGLASSKISQIRDQNQETNTEVQNTGPGAYIGIGAVEDKSKTNNLNSNVQGYEHLLNQLNTIKSLSARQPLDETLVPLDKNIDLYSYGKLLKEVKGRLTEYKKLLEQKTGSSR